MAAQSKKSRPSGQSGSRPASKSSAQSTPSKATPGKANAPAPGKAPSTGWRRELERRSAPALIVLHGLPRWLVPIAMGLLLLVGLLGPRIIGGVALLCVGAFLGWLLAVSWPLISGSARMIRLLVVAAVLGVGIARLVGWYA